MDKMEEAAQVKELLEVMRNYSPTIPEEVVEYYLNQVGFVTNDPLMIRMIALVAHKFLLDVTHDAMQFQRIRTQNSSSLTSSSSSSSTTTGTGNTNAGASNGETKTVLTMEDLAASLREYGVNLCKPEYFSDIATGSE